MCWLDMKKDLVFCIGYGVEGEAHPTFWWVDAGLDKVAVEAVDREDLDRGAGASSLGSRAEKELSSM